MRTPDKDTVEAIDRLSNTRDFQTFVRWLEDAVANETRLAISTDGCADVPRGRAQFGMEVLETVHGNPVAVQKILRKVRGPTPVR